MWLEQLVLAYNQTGIAQYIVENNLLFITPEILILLSVVLGLFETLSKKPADQLRSWNVVTMGTIFALVTLAAIFSLFYLDPATGSVYSNGVSYPVLRGAFKADVFSVFFRGLILLCTLLVLLFSRGYMASRSKSPGEFYVLLLGAALGSLFLTGAADLITFFVALETLGITSFILAGYLRDDLKSTEASLKYLLYGGTATAVLLFGTSLLMGITGGQTQFDAIGMALQALPLDSSYLVLLPVIVTLMMGGFGFKLSAAPFHLWTPDVYEGSPTPVTAFLSVVSKLGGFAILIRVLSQIFLSPNSAILHSPFATLFSGLFLAMAIASMVIGNVMALKQPNIKRMLAYSTIAHVGYMLVGFVALGNATLSSVLYYLITYVFMNLGAFALVVWLGQVLGRDDIQAYSGLIQKRPVVTLFLSIFLLSLAGIPITAGFFAKFFLFQSVITTSPNLLWLVVLGLLNSTISLYYYLNVIRVMVIAEPSKAVQGLSRTVTLSMAPVMAVATICLVATLWLGVAANGSLQWAEDTIAQLYRKDPWSNIHLMSSLSR